MNSDDKENNFVSSLSHVSLVGFLYFEGQTLIPQLAPAFWAHFERTSHSSYYFQHYAGSSHSKMQRICFVCETDFLSNIYASFHAAIIRQEAKATNHGNNPPGTALLFSNHKPLSQALPLAWTQLERLFSSITPPLSPSMTYASRKAERDRQTSRRPTPAPRMPSMSIKTTSTSPSRTSGLPFFSPPRGFSALPDGLLLTQLNKPPSPPDLDGVPRKRKRQKHMPPGNATNGLPLERPTRETIIKWTPGGPRHHRAGGTSCEDTNTKLNRPKGLIYFLGAEARRRAARSPSANDH